MLIREHLNVGTGTLPQQSTIFVRQVWFTTLSPFCSGTRNVGIDKLALCRNLRRRMQCCSDCCLPPVHSCKRGVRISWSVSLKFSLRLMHFVRKSLVLPHFSSHGFRTMSNYTPEARSALH